MEANLENLNSSSKSLININDLISKDYKKVLDDYDKDKSKPMDFSDIKAKFLGYFSI